MKGEVSSYVNPRFKGHEQGGERFAVVVQSDELHLSTWLVAPTSTRVTPTIFRPEVEFGGRRTFVCTEQTTAIDPERLGKLVAYLAHADVQRIDAALRLVLDL